MEAMAIGIPSVSTDCSPGGARMLIKNKINGFLINCNKEKELVEILDYLYDKEEILERIGNEAKKISEKIAINSIVNEWYECINRFTK